MKETLKILQSHVSIRQFTGEDISNENEMLIVSTAQRSSTSSNRQAYSIIGIRDNQKKEKLA